MNGVFLRYVRCDSVCSAPTWCNAITKRVHAGAWVFVAVEPRLWFDCCDVVEVPFSEPVAGDGQVS